MASSKEATAEMKEEEAEEEEEEEDMEEQSEEEEDDDESLQKAKQAITCRSVTLNTLMEDGIIQPGEGVLSIDYLGQRFEADLLESGKIKWQGSQEEFGTPSAWALHCKRLVNPIKRSGCGWASVKYKNRKLDIWKSMWARKHRMANPFKSPHQTSSTPPSMGSPSSASTSTTITASSTTTATISCTSSTATTDSATTSTAALVEASSLSSPPPSSSLSAATSTPSSVSSKNESKSEKCNGDQRADIEMKSSDDSTEQKGLEADVNPSVSSLDVSEDSASPKTQKLSPTRKTKSGMQDDCTIPLNLTTITPPVKRGDGRQAVHSPRFRGRYDESLMPKERKSVLYSSLGTRGVEVDPHTLVKCEQFDNLSKIQPFTVSITSNTLLLMDFHSHLTKSEIVGYLGGRWDSHKQHLSIEQAFPACCRLGDKERAPLIEEEIRRSMRQKNQMVVGWYHSHPYCQPDPSIRDIDCQMSYQLKMRGAGSMYLPCIGFILAPFEKYPPKPDSKIQAFWVMPNLEHPSSFNIPMHVMYSIIRDFSLTEDLLADMKTLTQFYSGAVDRVHLKDHWGEAITYMDKIKASLRSKLPEDQLDSVTFLDYVQQLLRDMK